MSCFKYFLKKYLLPNMFFILHNEIKLKRMHRYSVISIPIGGQIKSKQCTKSNKCKRIIMVFGTNHGFSLVVFIFLVS